MSHTPLATLVLGLLAAPSLMAGDLSLVLHGTITQTLAPVTGPLAGITVGERFVARVVVDDSPTAFSPQQYGYNARFARGGLTVEARAANFDPLAASSIVWASAAVPNLGDSLDVYLGLAGGDADMQILVRDPALGLLSGPDLRGNLGHLALPAAPNLAQLVLRDASQAVTTVGHVLFAEIVDLAQQRGENVCVAAVNQSGRPARMAALGSVIVGTGTLSLECTDLPNQVFGYFLNSRSAGFSPNPGGSRGTLCLSGPIGRFATFAASTGATGRLQLTINLGPLPSPSGTVAVQPGDTWVFQCWFRDFAGTQATSNFSDAVWLRFE